MEEPIPEDEIKETYTFEDWWEGRVFFGAPGLCVDVNFEYSQKNKGKRFNRTFKAISPRINGTELKKITTKQEEIFYQTVNRDFDAMQKNFIKNIKESRDKTRLLDQEIETYEKLFYEENFPVGPVMPLGNIQLGNRAFTPMYIKSVRWIYQERFVKGKRDFSSIGSPRCHFRFGSSDQQIYQVEAYVKYFKWLKDYKKHYDNLLTIREPKPVDAGMPVNEFQFLENMIFDIETHSKLYWVYITENNIKDVEAERKKYKEYGSDELPGERKFFEDIFKDELKRIKDKIHSRASTFLDKDSKSAFLNQMYFQLFSLSEKNNERAVFWKKYNNESDSLKHARFGMELWQLMDSFQKDFKYYLDPDFIYNTDEKKFEHCFLHQYFTEYEIILKHKPDCKDRIKAEVTAENLFNELKAEYLEQYDYIVQKWIKKNREKGHIVSETNFIHYQLKRLNTLFTADKEKQTLSATDYEQKVFTYSKSFYDKYMTEFFLFLEALWKTKLIEIESLSIPVEIAEKSKLKAGKSKPSSEDSFVYILKGSDREINLDQLHDKLSAPESPFIKKPKDIRNFRKIFSGEKILTPIIWLGTNYELNYFVSLLHKNGKIEKCNRFSIAIHCFLDKDNQKINYTSLRTAKKRPGDQRAVLLENMIDAI